MSLDAMDWVWTQSAAKGNARMVLIAIADKCRGPECTAYAGTAMLMRHVNASRTSVRESVDKLIALRELEIVEGAKGPRGETVYRLPGAVGHLRFAPDETGRHRAGIRPGVDLVPGRGTAPRGTRSGPAPERELTQGGADSFPQNARNQEEHKEQQQPRTQQATPVVPDGMRHLASALQVAGLSVHWSLGLREQQDVQDLVERHGVDALVARAVSRGNPTDPPKPARYWLKVWGDLDGSSVSRGSNVVPFLPSGLRNHRDTLAAGLALLNEQEGLAR